MQYNCIIFILVAIGYIMVDSVVTVVADRPQDDFVDEYIDLVNVYFEHKHISILTQFTCFTASV